MAGRRRSSEVAYVEGTDWDLAMRDAMHHESVEVLRHQVQVERQERASMERSDYYFSLVVVGLSLGVGIGVEGLQRRSRRKK